MSEPEPEGEEAGPFGEAARWFARMRGPDAAGYRGAFDAWLAADPRHRAEYNRAAEIFSIGKTALRKGKQARTRLLLLASLAAALLLAGGAWVLSQQRGGRMDSPGVIAKDGRKEGTAQVLNAIVRRRVTLADGSVVSLAPGSSLRLAFTQERRDITLMKGFARFEVAHEPRPFVVLAGGGSVTAHGTVFEIGLSLGRQVSVRLIEGSIDVKLPATAAALPTALRRLHPGEAIIFRAAAPEAAVPSAPGPGAAGAEAARDYRDVRLGDLLEEANRTASRKLRLADPALAGKLVSGRFRIDDCDILAERLAALFGLAVDRRRPGEIWLRSQ